MTSETAAYLGCPDRQTMDKWRALWRQSDRATLFNGVEFFEAWQTSVGKGVDSGVLTVYRGGELTAILPVMRTRARRSITFGIRYDYDPADAGHILSSRRVLFPVRQISSVQSLPATALQPMLLCRSADLAESTLAVAQWLASASGWDQVTIPSFAGVESDAWQSAFASTGLLTFVDRIDRSFRRLMPPSEIDKLLRAAPKKFRQNVVRAERAAAREGLAVDIDSEPGCFERHLPALSMLAAASWKSRAEVDRDIFMAFEGRQESFMRSLAASFGRDVRPFFVTARVAGSDTAILFGTISTSSGMTLLLLFRDGRFDSASPGLLVLLAALRHARDLGLAVVDFNATADWVRHVVNDNRLVDNVCAFAPTPRGRCYRMIRRLAKPFRDRLASRIRKIVPQTESR